jgi:hypothetical protein
MENAAAGIGLQEFGNNSPILRKIPEKKGKGILKGRKCLFGWQEGCALAAFKVFVPFFC